MAKKKKKPNQKMQAWIDARKRHHTSAQWLPGIEHIAISIIETYIKIILWITI